MEIKVECNCGNALSVDYELNRFGGLTATVMPCGKCLQSEADDAVDSYKMSIGIEPV